MIPKAAAASRRALYERDCSVQRHHQKVVEVAPTVDLDASIRQVLAEAAVQLARTACYYSTGTVEFLVAADSGKWYFIDVNPRIQEEHTVTEMVTGIDLVRAQIQVAQSLSPHDDQMRLARSVFAHYKINHFAESEATHTIR